MYEEGGTISKLKPKITHMKLDAYDAEWLKDNQHTPFLMFRGSVCLEWFVLIEYSLIKMKTARSGVKIWHARERRNQQSAEEKF
jgi:hypothetical protein